MRRVVLPALTALIAGCSQQGSEPPSADAASSSTASTASGGASEPASGAATIAETASNPVLPVVSRYTSLKDCKVIKDGAGEDWSVSRCEGHGGFALQIDYGDARDELRLVRGGKLLPGLGLINFANGGFNSIGDTVEWRGREDQGKFSPTRLILRNHASLNPEDSAKQTAILMVVDLEQECIVGAVQPKPGQNEAARALADEAQRGCALVDE